MSRKILPNNTKFSWLKDSEGVWNYARIVGFTCLIIFQPLILAYVFIQKLVPDINNQYQWLILCMPSIVSVLLLLIDFFRDRASLRIHFGEVDIESNKNKSSDEDNTEVPEE